MRRMVCTLVVIMSLFVSLFTFTQQSDVSNIAFDSGLKVASDSKKGPDSPGPTTPGPGSPGPTIPGPGSPGPAPCGLCTPHVNL